MSQDSTSILPTMDRRTWLKSMGALTGLTLTVGVSGVVQALTPAQPYGGDAMPGATVNNPLVFVSIDSDGVVTIMAHRAEMGQGIRSSLPMVVADELEADWSKVRVVQADADQTRYGNQNTDGSRSMRHFFMPMRQVGASAKKMLEVAAAIEWGVPVSEVKAQNHQVIHAKSGRALGYGALAAKAATQPVPTPAQLTLKTPEQFRYIGKSTFNSVDYQAIVTGKTQYGIDVRMDGMVYAVIARPPVLGSALKSCNDAAALQVPGVLRVIPLASYPLPAMFNPLGGVAVIASNTWAAIKGREALELTWEQSEHESYDSEAYLKELQQVSLESVKPARNQGDALAVIAQAERKIAAEYYVPHLAHATMEPPVATAKTSAEGCEIWACVQDSHAARTTVAGLLGLPVEKVTVHVTLLGGGFGRKSKPDFAAEAALLSKAMGGKPVKVTWTREDDIRHDYYHAVSLERLEAALDSQGKASAWLHRTVGPTISSTFVAGATGKSAGELGMSAVNIPFDIPNIRIESPGVAAHTRIGWFRSVANIPHAFAVQSFVAELAQAAGVDHKTFLLDLIGSARKINPVEMGDTSNYGESPTARPLDTARLSKVIELACAKAEWGRELPAGQGLGLAVAYSFMTYVAVVIEAHVDDQGKLTVPSVHIAMDCGPQITPDRIRSQAEGACIMGLSLALSSQISFKNGAVEQSNFHDYEVLRAFDAPKNIHVHLVEHGYDMPLGGVGEPATPPIAPALCNAIFAATGKRIRHLPIRDQLINAK